MTNPSLLAQQEELDALASPPGTATAAGLQTLTKIISRSGNPDEPFFYLGGQMSGLPKFNFPEFHRVADILRDRLGYNIISPAELDDPETERAAMESEDGSPGTGSANGEVYEDFLRRDIVVVSLPTCKGGILLRGWHLSRGARAESWVIAFLGGRLFEYSDAEGIPHLMPIRRDERLRQLNVPLEVAGAVPVDKPGEVTQAALNGGVT